MIGIGGERHYGRKVGEQVTHPMVPGETLVIIDLHPLDNNRLKAMILGGDKHGYCRSITAEHCDPMPRNERCQECGKPVYSYFDHVDIDCLNGEAETIPEPIHDKNHAPE